MVNVIGTYPYPSFAVRVDNWIIWPDGRYRKMSWYDRIAWKLGKRTYKL
jgi:hypothetical protein